MSNMYTANQDIRDYMADHCVTQRMLAAEIGLSQYSVNKKLQTELSQKDKEIYLNLIDNISAKVSRRFAEDALAEEALADEPETLPEETTDTTVCAEFQIGDRVKVPSKANKICIVKDIWHSIANASVMYAVEDEAGNCGLYAANQLEPAPVPIEYRFEANIDGNAAVVVMTATQGEKTWVYARGHAHILHDGEVGMAQAISYAARRMFESLDKQQENKIYVR